jgi:hypothetical protein
MLDVLVAAATFVTSLVTASAQVFEADKNFSVVPFSHMLKWVLHGPTIDCITCNDHCQR